MSETAASASALPAQNLELQVTLPPIQGGSLKQLRRELEAIDTYLGKIQNRFTEVGRRSGTRTGTAGFEAQLKSLKEFDAGIEATARKLGVLTKQNAGQFARITDAYRRNNPTQFRTNETAQGIPSMARILAHFEERMGRRQDVYDRAFRNYLFGGKAGPSVTPRVSEVSAVNLNDARLVAALERLTVAVETKGVVAAGTGQGAGTAAAEKKEREFKDPASIADQPNQVSKKIRSGKGERSTTTVDALAGGQTLETVFDSKGNPKTKIQRLSKAMEKRQDFLDLLANEQQVLKAAGVGRRKGRSAAELGSFADAYDQSAKQIQATADGLDESQRNVAGRPILRRMKLAAQGYATKAKELRALAAAQAALETSLTGKEAQSLADAIANARQHRRRENYQGQLTSARMVTAQEKQAAAAAAEAERQAAAEANRQQRAQADAQRSQRQRQTQQQREARQLFQAVQAAKTQDQKSAVEQGRQAKRAKQETERAQRSTQLNLNAAEAQRAQADLLAQGYARGKTTNKRDLSAKGNGQGEYVEFVKEDGGRRIKQQFTNQYKNGQLATVGLVTVDTPLAGPRAPKGPKPPKPPADKDAGKGFLENTEQVTRWAASVGALYGSLALARTGLRAFLDLSYEVARLDQVYQKQGGTTKALADDVLRLAAANGRNSKEALQSATSWARLGLTRLQINEAVRVSLTAANVAELDTLEATKYLQSTMAAYGLQVRQISGFLSGLNDISNKFNVTNADLLEGISKVANVAKQAGIPLEELRGLIGAAVGTTGQTGANIGNALKSIIVALSNPVLQKTLNKEFKLDAMLPDQSDLKNFSDLLGDLFVRYQDLNNAERQSLLFQVAGKTQASKLAGLLDSYVKGLELAANATLNLTSAEKENELIIATLRNRLGALATEFERFALIQGGKPAEALGGALGLLRNALGVLNLPGVSHTVTLLTTLLAVLSVRLLLTGKAIGEAGGKMGYLDKSLKNVTDRFRSLNQRVSDINGSFSEGTKRADRFMSVMGSARFRRGISDWSLARKAAGEMFRADSLTTAGAALGFAGAGYARGGARMAVGGAQQAAGFMRRLGLAGALTVGAAIPEILAGVAAITAVTWTFEKASSAFGLSTAGADKATEAFAATMNKLEARAGNAASSLRLLSVAMRTLGSGSVRPQVVDQLLLGLQNTKLANGQPLVDAAGAQRLRASVGNPAGVRAVLEASRTEAMAQQINAQVEAAAQGQVEIERLDREIQRVRNPVDRAKLEVQKTQQMTALNNLRSQLAEGDVGDELARTEERKLTLLKKQELVLGSIAQIYKLLGGVSPFTQHTADLAAAAAAVQYLEAEQDSLLRQQGEFAAAKPAALAQAAQLRAEVAASQPKYAQVTRSEGKDLSVLADWAPDFGLGIKDNLRAQIQTDATKLELANSIEKSGIPTNGRGLTVARNRAIEAGLSVNRTAREQKEQELNYLASPEVLEAKRFESLLADAKRDQTAKNATFGVGGNDTERLLDRRNALEREAGRLFEQSATSAEAAARHVQTQVDLLETENQLKERGYRLEQDIAQARLESQREFNRSFMEGDATSRLKQLAALQASKLGMTKTAGGYLALGDLTKYLPEEERVGGRLSELRGEQRTRSAARQDSHYRATSEEAIQRGQAQLLGNSSYQNFATTLAKVNEISGTTAVSLRAMEKSAGRAAERLGELADAVGVAAQRLVGWQPGQAMGNPQSQGRGASGSW